MNYEDAVERLRSVEPDLAAAVAPFQTLERVLAWMRQHEIPLAKLDLVAQDEYSHDVLIPLEPGPRWLVFGST
jgi:hypothetical protein